MSKIKLFFAFVFLLLLNLNVWADATVRGTVENIYDDKVTIVLDGVEYIVPEGYVDDYYIEVGDELIIYIDENENVYDISFVGDELNVDDTDLEFE